MRRARLFLSLLLPAVVAQTSLAAAADPHNAEQATRDFNKGLELMKSGHPDDARIKFVEANGLVRSTDILWNLILAEAASEHYADAVQSGPRVAPAGDVPRLGVPGPGLGAP